MGKALVLEKMTVFRGKLRVLDQISLRVDPGELICITGLNGVGKSTLFQAVIGLCPLTEGHIFYGGEELTGTPVSKRLKLGLALVPEGRHVFPGLSVKENLLLGCSVTFEKGDLREMYQMFPILERYQNRPAGVLSGGEQQQLALARALMGNPRCILLDEPTMGLSPRLTQQVFRDLRGLRDQGKSLVVSSQRSDQLAGEADRAFSLRGGKLYPL